jgi:DNA-binding FadR family transcriptional regulator
MLEPLTARGTFVRAASPERGRALNAMVEYSDEELMGLRRALDVEAVQSAAAHWDPSDPERLGYLIYAEEDRLRGGGPPDPRGTHCTRFHSAIVRSSNNRLLIDLDESLSAALQSRGVDRRVTEAMEVAICVNEHDRILTAIRGKDVAAAAHIMALHLDAMLRGFHLIPIVTDLTSLTSLTRTHRGAMGGSLGVA